MFNEVCNNFDFPLQLEDKDYFSSLRIYLYLDNNYFDNKYQISKIKNLQDSCKIRLSQYTSEKVVFMTESVKRNLKIVYFIYFASLYFSKQKVFLHDRNR